MKNKFVLGHKYEITSFAKLNLLLNIIGQKVDPNAPFNGYHLLNMLNVYTNIHDIIWLKFSKSSLNQIKFKLGQNLSKNKFQESVSQEDSSSLSQVTKNLASQAVIKLFEAFEINLGFEIEIEKNIPFGAGLGGGSSNAASVMNFVFHNFNEILANVGKCSDFIEYTELKKTFRNIAINLGSDVPFFLDNEILDLEVLKHKSFNSTIKGLTKVTGIGESVYSYNFFQKNIPVVILNPGIHISTKDIFQKYKDRKIVDEKKILAEKNLISQHYDRNIFFDSLKESIKREEKDFNSFYHDLISNISNDLTSVVIKEYPFVDKIISFFKQFSQDFITSMTGSGSCIFILPCNPEINKLVFYNKIYDYIFGENSSFEVFENNRVSLFNTEIFL